MIALVLSLLVQIVLSQASSRPSDGFDFPLGAPSGQGYGVLGFGGLDFEEPHDYADPDDGFPEYHPGEDWNDDDSGIDMRGDSDDAGDTVFAVSNGVIRYASYSATRWGHVVLIEHTAPQGASFVLPNGTSVSTVWSQYGHMASIALNPRTGRPWMDGEAVFRGEPIGVVGDYLAGSRQNFHLHFEIRIQFRPATAFVNNTFADSTDFQPWSRSETDRYYVDPTAFVLLNRNVLPPPPPPVLPTCTLSAAPPAINIGGSSTLSWTTTGNPTTASIDNGIGAVVPTTSGSVNVAPTADTTYTMTVTNVAGSSTCSASVIVNTGPPSGSGIWNSRSQMPTARTALASAEVNGEIYAIGGALDSSGINVVATVEAFSSNSDTWVARASMPTPRALLAAAETSGIIYAVGGCTGIFCTVPLATVEAYDPSTNQWTPKTSMPTARYGLIVAVVNGILYTIGGANQTTILDTVEAYNPATDTWLTRASMPTARRLTAGGTINSLIYVVGGRDATDSAVEATEVYDPANDSWSTVALMSTARGSLAAGVSDGKLYTFGGFAGPGLPSTSALLTADFYDPVTDMWTTVADLPTARGGLTVSASSGVLFAIGGAPAPSGSLALGVVEAFGPVTTVTYDGNALPGLGAPSWTRLQPACPVGVSDATSATSMSGILEILDFDTACDHWYGRNNEMDSTDDVSMEWIVRVPFSSHPAAVVAGFADGMKVIYVGHTASQVGILQQDANSGAVSFLGTPFTLDATSFHTYRLAKNSGQTVQLFVDGVLQQTISYSLLPSFPVASKQFFGAGANFERSQSFWDLVTYTVTRKP